MSKFDLGRLTLACVAAILISAVVVWFVGTSMQMSLFMNEGGRYTADDARFITFRVNNLEVKTQQLQEQVDRLGQKVWPRGGDEAPGDAGENPVRHQLADTSGDAVI